jgi:hypothetical protein
VAVTSEVEAFLMRSCAIRIDEVSFRKGANNITGVIYIELGNIAFPERGWNDFPVVIVTWWLQALIKLLAGTPSEQTFLFMDGPFEFRVASTGGPTWNLQCIARGSHDTCVLDAEVDASAFATALVHGAREIVRACSERGWPGEVAGVQYLADQVRVPPAAAPN